MAQKRSNSDLVRAAMAAWFRGGETVTPKATSDVVTRAGLRYVRLFGASGLLAVYRVRNDGILRRMRRWPKTIE